MTAFALYLCWFTLGAMIFFGAVVAPIVFTTLEAETAGQFLRKLFPRLYFFCGLVTAISACLFGLDMQPIATAAIAATSLLFFIARGPLTTAINTARDAQLNGDEAAGRRFDRLHRLSTRIFGLQALTLLGIALWIGHFSS